MSFDAIRWAMDQPARPALTKFVLVAMAECVNAEGAETVCWPSYAHLCQRTGMNTKTVEQAVFNLKQEGYIVDTGRRAGTTGKVVVYRLNATENGCIQPGPRSSNANGTRPHNTTNSGGVPQSGDGTAIPPNTAANPPKFDGQSPQIPQLIPPKTGAVSSNGSSKGTKKESGKRAPAKAVASIDGVPPKVLEDWLAVRKDKSAGTLTDTAVEGLMREAGKAGLSAEEAIRYCIDANWIGFNAGFYAKRESQAAGATATRPHSKHAGFAGKNYREGVNDDGSFH